MASVATIRIDRCTLYVKDCGRLYTSELLHEEGQAVHGTLALARAALLVVLAVAVRDFHAEVACSQLT